MNWSNQVVILYVGSVVILCVGSVQYNISLSCIVRLKWGVYHIYYFFKAELILGKWLLSFLELRTILLCLQTHTFKRYAFILSPPHYLVEMYYNCMPPSLTKIGCCYIVLYRNAIFGNVHVYTLRSYNRSYTCTHKCCRFACLSRVPTCVIYFVDIIP